MSPIDRHPPRFAALLFDVEGVIAHPDRETLDDRLRDLAPGIDSFRLDAARNTERTYALWQRYSRGVLSREAYWAPILEELGVEPSPRAIRALSAAQRDGWWASLSEPVLAIARSARRNMRIGLLSNSAPEHEAHIPRFAGGFDIVCFSHRMGLRKPDPEAYLEAARRLEVAPEGIFFVDDKERNVEAARRVGMHGVRFTDPSTLVTDLADLADLPGLGAVVADGVAAR